MTAFASAGVLDEVARDDAGLRRWLHGLPGVDEVGANARAAMLGTRSIKNTSKRWALDLAIRMVDLTTLEGADTAGTVRSLAAKARRPIRRTRAARRSRRSASTTTWSASPRSTWRGRRSRWRP